MADKVRYLPSDAVAKWEKNTKGKWGAICAAVNKVTAAPGIKAAAQKQKWINKLADKDIKDKWKLRCGQLTISDWAASFGQLTSTQFDTLVSKGQTRMEAFMSWLLGQLATPVATLDTDPLYAHDGTYERAKKRGLLIMAALWNKKYPKT